VAEPRPPPRNLVDRIRGRNNRRLVYNNLQNRWLVVRRNQCPVAFEDPGFQRPRNAAVCNDHRWTRIFDRVLGSVGSMFTYRGRGRGRMGFCENVPLCHFCDFCPALSWRRRGDEGSGSGHEGSGSGHEGSGSGHEGWGSGHEGWGSGHEGAPAPTTPAPTPAPATPAPKQKAAVDDAAADAAAEAATTVDAAAAEAATTVDAAEARPGAAYCSLDTEHTMCKYQGPSASCAEKTIFRSLSSAGKEAILDRHNSLRRRVAKGKETGGINPPQPGAANMRKLVWSTELEQIAQRWADQCTFGHDSVRTKLDGTGVGQNAFIGYSSAQSEEGVVQAAMAGPAQSWYDEVTRPGFDSQHISPFKFSWTAGHYTQLVWADTEELGCAVVYFKDTSALLDYNNLVVCNYAVAGNLMGSVMYQAGAACSACPQGYSCEDDGLCAKPS